MKFTDVDKKYEKMEKDALAPKPVVDAKDAKKGAVPAKAGKAAAPVPEAPKKKLFGLF
jgi:hypothetical protein